MGEDYCVGYGGGVSCTEERASAVFMTGDGVASSSLRSSLGLTCKVPWPWPTVKSGDE